MFTRQQCIKIALVAFGLGSLAQAVGYAIGSGTQNSWLFLPGLVFIVLGIMLRPQ